MKIGDKVRIVGFRAPTGSISSDNAAKSERDHVDSFIGHLGEIEAIDKDPEHPYTVWFGEGAKVTRCRFSIEELAKQ